MPITFRTGTHNPLTLYVIGPTYQRYPLGYMRDGETSIGWLPSEKLAALAVEAWNRLVCRVCPWGCPSCSLNQATCECYEHGGGDDDNNDDDDESAAVVL